MFTNYIQYACRYSIWLQHQLNQNLLNTNWLEQHLPHALEEIDLTQFQDWYHLDESQLAQQLRILRRHVLAHIMIRDLCHISDLAEVTHTITQFAEFAVNTALNFAYQTYVTLYGHPIGNYSKNIQYLNIIAMGKAGGHELNVSSDIDLIFVYPENGHTNGKRQRSNQEFFVKVGQKLIALLHEMTADGQVFRVDMRLRPDGDSGALVLNETALEHYLSIHGREWERYAWCKARIITPYPHGLNELIRPFVFRKYLDFQAYEAMRTLHEQIRAEIQKKQLHNNIKLGAGGIREIEFIAQIFQMIRGGQNRTLQLKGTQETLIQLGALQLLSSQQISILLEAYRFLRNIEHRLQYWDDQQTQTLPTDTQQQQLLAESLNFSNYDDFLKQLNIYRNKVEVIFNSILGKESTDTHPLQILWHNIDDDDAISQLDQLGFTGQKVILPLRQLLHSTKYRHLSKRAQQRVDAILPMLLETAALYANADITLLRLLTFLENISRRSVYLAFLQQHNTVLKHIADIMSKSAWLAQYLTQYPIVLDELLSTQLLQPLNIDALEQELSTQLTICEDIESKMDVLRRFRHAHIFRLAVQDLAGLWTLEALSDQLSLLADIILKYALQHAWQTVPHRHHEQPRFAIIAYGKLGGKELSYTSDLDLVYLYDDDHSESIDRYAKLARRLNTWLNSNTGAGTLYDIDLRLRPNGDSGFLIHSVSAFAKYQQQNAWTWEHQALSRARFVCGYNEIGTQFEHIRRTILSQPRNLISLQQNIIHMRDKISQTHPYLDNDIKYARGGIVDVEFIVQYLVLAHAHQYPQLLENKGNIALLHFAAQNKLITNEQAHTVGNAYRYFRQQQHQQKLYENHIQINDILINHYCNVRKLWAKLFTLPLS